MSQNTNCCRPFFVKYIRNKLPYSRISPYLYMASPQDFFSRMAVSYVCYLYVYLNTTPQSFSSLSLIAMRYFAMHNYCVICEGQCYRPHVRGKSAVHLCTNRRDSCSDAHWFHPPTDLYAFVTICIRSSLFCCPTSD